MGRHVGYCDNLTTYLKRERDFRRTLPLIDGEDMLSLDVPENSDLLQFLAARPADTHTAKWEFERIKLAAAMLPKRCKRYQRVLWSIYYHHPNKEKMIAGSGLGKSQYYAIFMQLWHFFTARRSYFIRLNRLLA